MNKEKSLKKNYIYNLILTMLNILFPLVTSPYVSRVLGADNIGKVGFANSIAGWFVIITAFGIPTYGIREISKVRNDKSELSKSFSELIVIQIICTTIGIIGYLIVIMFTPRAQSEMALFLISGVSVLLNMFSMDWFYQGIEEYGYITIRSIVFKIISLVLIFVLVRTRSHYVIYSGITVFALSFSNILNYLHSRRFVTLKINGLNLKRHIGKLKIFLYSSLIVSVYSQLDMVILGFLSSSKDVAFFTRGKQITSIVLTLTLSLSTVLIPRASYLYDKDRAKYREILDKSINYIYVIAVPCVFGIIVLSSEIMWFFGGAEFINGKYSLSILAFLVLIVSISSWGYNQVLIPAGKEYIGLKSQLVMALASLVLNFILIPKMGYIGASIAIIIAESLGTVVGIYLIVKLIKFNYFTNSLFKYLIASILMSCGILIIKRIVTGYFLVLILSLIVGVIIYFVTLFIFKEKVSIEIIEYIKGKLKMHKK